MSYAIYDHKETDLAYDCFLEAKQLELNVGNLPVSTPSDSQTVCLGREECSTLAEVKELKGNKDAVVIEGFLIGQRIIPKDMAPEYLWTHLLEFAGKQLCQGKDFALCQSIVRFITELQLPPDTQLDPASVLDSLRSTICKVGHVKEFVSIIGLVLESFSNCVETLDVKKHGEMHVSTLCMTALNASLCHGDEMLLTILPQIEDIIKKMYREMEIDTRRTKYNVCATLEFLKSLRGGIVRFDVCRPFPAKETFRNFQRVFTRLLHLDNAAYTTSSGDTMLHLLTLLTGGDILKSNAWFDFDVAITKMVIRHGCPIEARNRKGLTAEELFYRNFPVEDDDGWSSSTSMWLALLSKQSSVLTLGELAARTVLKWKIPYADVLPVTLQKFLE